MREIKTARQTPEHCKQLLSSTVEGRMRHACTVLGLQIRA